ncbi:hypothetical protein [Sinorhizobium sp. NFACC03]|uniref:hypothetical protein n=1 Tax=Sinorhizobium sp. NFACC03 TaxID=1566295 RepID=UPI000889FB75|nr:hypothetical protein [Sinorhizobium sp. NFACC03]SDA91511.1 hypothetical protein SAMN03159448_04575 [Sinorhizobium sp. NFACC03]
MYMLPNLTGHNLSPHDIVVVRRVFEATCSKKRPGDHADRLARFIMDEFRFGNTDEASLLECALWHETRGILPEAKRHSLVDIQTALARENHDFG